VNLRLGVEWVEVAIEGNTTHQETDEENIQKTVQDQTTEVPCTVSCSDPVPCDAPNRLESGWVGENHKENEWDDIVGKRHLIAYDILNSHGINDAILLEVLVLGIIRIVTRLKDHTVFS